MNNAVDTTENWFDEILGPPKLTPEIEDKLEKTARLLQEMFELWNIPDTGVSSWDDIPDPEFTYYEEMSERTKREDLRRHKNWIFNWYQQQPFVPLFFNAQFYAILKTKMINHSKETND